MTFIPHDPLPVEETFDEAIVFAGGVRVSTVVGLTPDFENADYLFPKNEVVIELKEIQTDWPRLSEYQEKIGDLFCKCIATGRISMAHLDGSLPMPRDVRRDFMQILRKPIKRILEKANRQIRNTHLSLAHRNGKGVVILVIDGLQSVAPVNTMALVTKILLHDYSSITAVIAVTVNEYAGVAGDDYARLLWIPAYQDGAPDWLVDFVDDLGRRWFEHIDAKIGGFDDRSEQADRSFLDRTTLIGRTPGRG